MPAGCLGMKEFLQGQMLNFPMAHIVTIKLHFPIVNLCVSRFRHVFLRNHEYRQNMVVLC